MCSERFGVFKMVKEVRVIEIVLKGERSFFVYLVKCFFF